MKESQAEIKAIQAKLQAIQAGKTQLRQPPSPPSRMVELIPDNSSAIATLTHPQPQDDLSGAVETLQHRSTAYVRQFQTPPQQSPAPPANVGEQVNEALKRLQHASHSSQDSLERQLDEALKQLESQARRINQLSASQEAAMLEMKAIAEKAARDWKSTELENSFPPNFDPDIPTCEYETAVVPFVEQDQTGSFVLTTRSVDLFRAEREATLMAQTLRQRVNRPNASRQNPDLNFELNPELHRRRTEELEDDLRNPSLWNHLSVLLGKLLSRPSRSRNLRSQQSASAGSFSVQDAALWVIGAVAARVGINLVLSAFPGLWFPVIGLIVAPAAIAIYRTTVSPQAGFVWGCRLLLIMIGLLIGGRL